MVMVWWEGVQCETHREDLSGGEQGTKTTTYHQEKALKLQELVFVALKNLKLNKHEQIKHVAWKDYLLEYICPPPINYLKEYIES